MRDRYLTDQKILQTEQENDFLKRGVLNKLNANADQTEYSEAFAEELMPYIGSDIDIFRLYLASHISDLCREANQRGLPLNIVNPIKKEAFAGLAKAKTSSEIEEITRTAQQKLTQEKQKFSFRGYSYDVIRAVEYIHIQQYHPLSAADVAAHLTVERTAFSKKFHAETGHTLTDYIHMVKIDTAGKLILSHEFSLIEISDLLGYSSYKYFSKVFKKYSGVLPKDYILDRALGRE